jgi:hypothetical protein
MNCARERSALAGALTPAQRVIAAFEKRKTDKIAIYHSGCSSNVGSKLLGRTCYSGGGINQWREACALWEGPDAHAAFVEKTTQDARDLCKTMKADLMRIQYWRMPDKPTRRIDEYTFLYGDPDGDYCVRQLDPVTELYQEVDKRDSKAPRCVDDLEAEVIEAERALETCEVSSEMFQKELDALEYFGPEYEIPSFGFWLCVPNRSVLWIEAVAARPDLVARLLETQCLTSMKHIAAQKDLPFRVLMGGGDFCGNHGPNYSPRFFHEQMLPRLKRMNELAHKCGKFTVFATDGNTWLVGDDLWNASGIDGAHEIDRLAGMDHWRMRKTYPTLTCLGNISTITLHRGTKDEVIAQARDNAEAALELGGILPGVSNQIPAGTPIENVLAMIETLEEYH